MTDVLINYNPYKVQTTIQINGEEIGAASPLFYTQDHRLQEWIEPRGHWGGIFNELKKSTGDSAIRIRFYGTAFDFDDLIYARNKYGSVFQKADLIHLNKATCEQHNQVNKIKELEKLYSELQSGPIEEFKTPDIKKAFEAAISSDFEIVVVAPMSSGKSTLINAILGKDLLPAVNEATTAVITRICDDDNAEKYTVSAYDRDHKEIRFKVDSNGEFVRNDAGEFIISADGKPVKELPADLDLISQLNYAKDPSDKEGKRALVSETVITGQIPAIPADKLSTIFVDTPGGNNSQNDEHRELMEKAIRDENKSLILYVFNGTQTGTNDSDAILELIASEMRKSSNGKQSRDRFLFVANRMDDFDPEKEDYSKYIENSILPGLIKYGITEPNLFLVSAQLAKLLRMQEHGQRFTKRDRSWLNSKIPLFGDVSEDDESYRLYRYSAISDKQKAEFDAQIEKLIEANPDEQEINAVAEINSGIPAVEAAIRDYVDKYAISIKIKVAHDTFMRKVTERAMVDECEARWVASKEELEKVRAEVVEKRKKYQSRKELSEYRSRIERITFNEAEVLSHEAQLRKKVDSISALAEKKKKIKKAEAETLLRTFKKDVEEAFEEAGKTLMDTLNKNALIPCNQIVAEYSQFVKSLEDGGFFSLGGLEVKKLSDFKRFEIPDVDSLLEDDKFIKLEDDEDKPPRRVKKSGFFNFFRRIFGTGGWDSIQDQAEYVYIGDLVKDKISECMTGFSAEVSNNIEITRGRIDDVKAAARNKLQGIDRLVEQALRSVEESVANEEALKEKVAANEKNRKWIQDFISRVDSILEI